MAFKLDPARAPGADIARLVRDRLADAIAAAGNPRRSSRERIHAARTSTKKLRAALKLVRTQDKKTCRRENRALRDAARELSLFRDAEVMLAAFDAVLKHYAVPRKKFAAVRAFLLAHRRAVIPAKTALERPLRAFASRLRKVRQRLRHWEPEIDFAAIARDFGRTHGRGRRSLRALQVEASAEACHEWRKATRACACQCRLLRAAWPLAMKGLGAELKALASLLGYEHDLSVLRAHLRTALRQGRLELEEETAAAVLGLIGARRDELRAEALPRGLRLFADKRGAVEARMILWWAAARTQPAASPAVVSIRSAPS